MPRLDPRTFTIQQEVEHQLQPLMTAEAVVLVARVMAHLVCRDTTQFTPLTDLFKSSFGSEYEFIQQQRRGSSYERAKSGGIS
jgi:hypothetical protein